MKRLPFNISVNGIELKIFLFFLISLVLPCAHASSSGDKDNYAPKMVYGFNEFKQIPLLDSGRVKPLDTYARNILLQFSGKDTFDRKPAIQWLAKLFFAPETAKNDKVFLINSPDIAVALGIPIDAHRRYSIGALTSVAQKLSELAQAAARIPEKQRSIVEAEITRVYENVELCASLSQSVLFAVAHEDFTVTSEGLLKALNLPNQPASLSYLDVAMHLSQIRQLTKSLEVKDPSRWDADDRNAAILLKNFVMWSKMFDHMPLVMMPASAGDHQWLNPWDAIHHDLTDNKTRLMLFAWQDMANAYWEGDQVHFDLAAKVFTQTVLNRADPESRKKISKFPLELAYNSLMPFLWARIFYILAFICFVSSLLSKARGWYVAALACVVAGLCPHVGALIARIIIMSRPPVSSLYETFIFVGCICVILGLWVERINKQWLGIVVSSICGSAFLFIASRYSAEGDTLKMLVAVLNSNFWLATHVTTITMGYSATCVAGLLGHVWLIQAVLKKDKNVLDNTYSVMIIILGIALTLTFLGTNLGGIWADQSWGRFWGWDPKENGALMIVLWTIMLFHARIGKVIGNLGMAVGSSLGVVVVMWAWFGVNLLSIGLHSYGFTSGVAASLAVYVTLEAVFLSITAYLVKKNDLRFKGR